MPWFLADSPLSPGTLSAYIGIGMFVAAVVGGLVAYLVRRRGTTGSVGTSDAQMLWSQAQTMMSMLEAQRDKAIDQRDKLMEAQSSQVIPLLASLNETMQQMSTLLEVRTTLFTSLSRELEEQTGKILTRLGERSGNGR